MVNSLGLKNTILESLSKNQLVCLKQETMYIAGWIETFHFTTYIHILFIWSLIQ